MFIDEPSLVKLKEEEGSITTIPPEGFILGQLEIKHHQARHGYVLGQKKNVHLRSADRPYFLPLP